MSNVTQRIANRHFTLGMDLGRVLAAISGDELQLEVALYELARFKGIIDRLSLSNEGNYLKICATIEALETTIGSPVRNAKDFGRVREAARKQVESLVYIVRTGLMSELV